MVERTGNCDISFFVPINKKSVSGYYQMNFIIDKAGWLGLEEGEKMLPAFLNYINSNKIYLAFTTFSCCNAYSDGGCVHSWVKNISVLWRCAFSNDYWVLEMNLSLFETFDAESPVYCWDTKITASHSQGLSSASVSVIQNKRMFSDLVPAQQHPQTLKLSVSTLI